MSLFSGVEAASLAWQDFGWQAAAFAEIEPFPCAVLAHHWPTVPNLGDVSEIDWQELGTDIDLLIGGSPCQAFSVAGLRRGLDDARGNLIFEYLRAVRDTAPEWVVFENVPGLLSINKGAALTEIIAYLTSLGYAVDADIYDAQDFGVPQRRRRVFLVGHRLDLGLRHGVPEAAQALLECLAEASYLALHGNTPEATANPATVTPKQAARKRARAAADYTVMIHAWQPNESSWAKSGDLVGDAIRQRLLLVDAVLARLAATPADLAKELDLALGATTSGSDVFTSVADRLAALIEVLRNVAQTDASERYARLQACWAALLPPLLSRINRLPLTWPQTSLIPALMEALFYDPPPFCQGPADDAVADEVSGFRDRHPVLAAACAELRELARHPRDERGRPEVLPVAEGVRRHSAASDQARPDASAAAIAGASAGSGAGRVVSCAERTGALTSNGPGVVGADDNAARSGLLLSCRRPTEERPCPEDTVAPGLRAGNPYNNSDAGMEAQRVFPTVIGKDLLAFYPHSGLEQIIREDISPTLVVGGNGGSPPAVAFSCKDDGRDATEDLAPTLRAMGHAGSHQNGGGQLAVALCLPGGSAVDERGESLVNQDDEPPLGDAPQDHEVLALAQNQRGELRLMRSCGALNQGGGKPGQDYPAILDSLAVRRLTPRECERLQGMPDDHTRISRRNQSAAQCPDGPRYKAIGNSFAVPVVRWIGATIRALSRRDG